MHCIALRADFVDAFLTRRSQFQNFVDDIESGVAHRNQYQDLGKSETKNLRFAVRFL